jgi:hypothetical protein
MSKNDYSWDEKKYKRFIKEERGLGIGRSYKPWLTTHEVPSKGRSSRGLGWKTGRLQHFFSDNETRYFYLLEWADHIVDIMEQYPLSDYEDAMKIAQDAGIKYPASKIDKFPYILTTDFMITLILDGKKVNIARTIKPTQELEKSEVIAKFEIERRYWLKRGIDWGIVTEEEIPRVFAANTEWLHQEYNLELLELGQDDISSLCNTLKTKLSSDTSSIRQICDAFDTGYNLIEGTALSLLKHMIARKQVAIDMEKTFDITSSAQALKVTGKDGVYGNSVGR